MKNLEQNLADIKTLHQAGKLKEAKQGYLDILTIQPDNLTALHMLGILSAELGDFLQAEAYLTQALAIAPDVEALSLHLANIYKAQGCYQKAYQLLKTLTQKYPRFAAAFNNLGTVLFALARLEDAVSAYQTAIALEPNYVDAYYNLGLAFNKLGRWQEARHAYQGLLLLSPQNLAAHFQIACIYLQEKNFVSAIEHFSLIEKNQEQHFETQSNLATAYLRAGDLNKAKLHYLKALSLNANDSQILFNLGVLSMQAGNIQEAINYYLQAAKGQMSLYEIHNNLGYAFLVLRQNNKALNHFREALLHAPHNEVLQHTVNILAAEKNISTSPLSYIESLFDSYADHYDEHLKHGLHYQVPEKMHRILLQNNLLGKGLQILDLGCGSGLSGERFKSHASFLCGVDISQKMLDLAKSKQIYSSLIHQDISHYLREHQQQFDLVIAADVLVYAGDLQDFFQNIVKVLKPHAYLIFNTEIDDTEDYCMTAAGRFAHKKSYVVELAQRNHLQLVKYEEIPLRTQDKALVSGHLFIFTPHA